MKHWSHFIFIDVLLLCHRCYLTVCVCVCVEEANSLHCKPNLPFGYKQNHLDLDLLHKADMTNE